MSTDYFLGCEKCREAYHIGQDGWKFFTFYSGEKRCMAGIGDFIGRHVNNEGCRLVVMSEHRIDADNHEWAYVEWPNVEHNRRTAASSPGVRVDGPVGPLAKE